MKYLVLIFLVLLTSCTNPNGAKDFLEKQGYTNIEIGGWGGFGFFYAEGDLSCTAFTATINGQQVSGAVSDNIGWLGIGAHWSVKTR